MEVVYRPIGVVRSPFKDLRDMPIQPCGAAGVAASVELFEEYLPGLKDLAGFSHVFLLYHFHRVARVALEVTPFLDSEPRGVFATRAPLRPNPIGLSVVRLREIDGAILHVEGIDILDGTPLLDVKPYVPAFDAVAAESVGWLESAHGRASKRRSDGRFA